MVLWAISGEALLSALPVKHFSRLLFARKTVYFPTLWGWAAILAMVTGFLWMTVANLYDFLAISDPIRTETECDVLVMEGWAPEMVVKVAAEIATKHDFDYVVSSGGVLDDWIALTDHETYSELGAHRLKLAGVRKPVMVVPPIPREVDRTRTDVRAVKLELERRGITPKTVTIVSRDVHMRRTKLVYRRTFGRGVEIRSFPAASGLYRADDWWESSAGVKTVIMEAISYIFEAVRVR